MDLSKSEEYLATNSKDRFLNINFVSYKKINDDEY